MTSGTPVRSSATSSGWRRRTRLTRPSTRQTASTTPMPHSAPVGRLSAVTVRPGTTGRARPWSPASATTWVAGCTGVA